MMRRTFTSLAVSLPILSPAFAGEPVSTSFFGNIAIGGKDTVSYHAAGTRKSHAVVEGDKRFEVQYLGATWRFASRESAQKFATDPPAYAPKYNGHCANALSLGEGLVKTDGSVWEFFGDKLYLFYAQSGRERWVKGDWQKFQTQAENAWLALLKKQ